MKKTKEGEKVFYSVVSGDLFFVLYRVIEISYEFIA